MLKRVFAKCLIFLLLSVESWIPSDEPTNLYNSLDELRISLFTFSVNSLFVINSFLRAAISEEDLLISAANNHSFFSSHAKEISEFRQYLLSSDIVLTASWFEVTSLIELDVLKNGKKLVTCSKSYNHSFFSNPFAFEAHDINECAEVIIKASKIENYQINGCYPDNDKIIKGYIDSL